jgi:N-methylhydantoinase A
VSYRVGIDTGGTFTDLVALDPAGRSARAKVPSTPEAPLEAVLGAFDAAGVDPAEAELVVLGTTVGTNALLQRRGARVAYLTTEGFEDVPFIQRGNRRSHYDLHWRKPRPFLDRYRCLGVRERVDHAGRLIVPLDEEQLDSTLAELEALEVDAVAVNLLFSYVNREHEQRVGDRVRQRLPGVTVSLSHEVAPVWREYERGVTTIADAYLKPLLGRFVGSLEDGLAERGFRGRCSLLKSNGGIQSAREAARRPVELSLSGLAGGVMGGCSFASGGADMITLDMGGTSCDIAVVAGGERRLASGHEFEFGLPLVFPTIEVATIGAGGGSIAWTDDGGFVRVGPESAGADPGPAAYGRGGSRPTVTDANLVLGRLDPDYFLGGTLPLDARPARDSLAPLASLLGGTIEDAALAVVRIANETMFDAIRVRTVEVGVDPREFTLVAFGGAGPLHACAIARHLGIRRVLVPPHPGLCSAYGAATAPLRSDRVATAYFRSDTVRASDVEAVVAALAWEASHELRAEGATDEPLLETRLEMRYAGQNYEHAVELDGAALDDAALRGAFTRFEALHEEFYGYRLGGQTIELVEVVVSATVASAARAAGTDPEPAPPDVPERSRSVRVDGGDVDATVLRRDALRPGAVVAGPAIVEEPDSTTLLHHGDSLTVLDDLALAIEVAGEED